VQSEHYEAADNTLHLKQKWQKMAQSSSKPARLFVCSNKARFTQAHYAEVWGCVKLYMEKEAWNLARQLVPLS